ncbi:RTA1 like protein [Aspergillus bertholletiae]|uniref:RTA1 like protein n=1 Tax=Aspergillus bertholletiae TaxID=1226010 RepID=A0A5N7AW77_9EURO|nr:RTA1 like protein [Aspergillus bertholletiae]
MAQLQPLKSGYYVWNYVPSVAAAIIFILLFLAITSFHFWKIYKTKVHVTLPFAIGGLFEFIGYAARAAAHDKTGKLMPFVIQSVFVLIAPTLFAAAVYMVLGRIIRSVRGEKYSPIRVELVTRTFVMCDILTFLVQGSGAGMMAIGSLSKTGQNIVLAGLILQIVAFSLFIVTAAIFYQRITRYITAPAAFSTNEVPWKKHLWNLFAISGLILIRSIFRVIEYALGSDGYLLKQEWCLYIFDTVPMFIAMVCFAICHPAELQPFLRGLEAELSETAVLKS